MSSFSPLDEVFDDASKLAEADRLALVSRLLETLPDDLPGLDADAPGFQEELLRRSGDAEGSVAWEELCDEVRTNP